MAKATHKAVLIRTTAAAALMFGFGYAMVPMYNLICDITGIGGRVKQAEAGQPVAIDLNRQIKVEFTSAMNQYMPWRVDIGSGAIKVNPGQRQTVVFKATNLTSQDMVGQAIPNITPHEATKYLHKLECFCFQQQTLRAGETRDMAVTFYIDPTLPADIGTVTLSYTFFDVTEAAAKAG